MIDTTALKEAIVSALGEQLGTYTFQSVGATSPAIRIDDGVDPFPEEPIVGGLECVIQPNLEVPISDLLGGYQQTWTASIVLKQFDITKDTLTAMDAITEAVAEIDGLRITSRRRVVRSNKLDNIETMQIAVAQVEIVMIYD